MIIAWQVCLQTEHLYVFFLYTNRKIRPVLRLPVFFSVIN